MSGMFFHVGADFDKLKKLKDDIDDIKVKLEGMDKAAQTQEFEKLEKDLQDLTKEFNKSAEAAAVTAKEIEQANHKIENTFDNSTEATKAFLEELNRSGKSVQSVVDDIEQSRQRTAKLFEFDPNTTGIESLKQQLEIQKKIVAELELQYEKAKSVYDTLNVSSSNPAIIAEREKASKLFREIRAELNGEKQGLQELEKEYTKLASEEEKRAKKAEANANKQLTIMTQMRQIREEMGAMKRNGIHTDEDIQKYEALKAKLKEVGTAYRIVQQEQKNLTTAGNAQLAGLINGISGFSGAYAAGQGFVSLFVKDTEKLAAIQTKLQAALSMTIGIQSAANALSVTSAFRINVMNRVTSVWTATQNRLTTALWGSTLAAKALMTVASLGLGLVIMGLISLYNRYTAKQEEALQKYKELREATTKHTAEVEKEETALVGLLLAIKNTNEGNKSRISLLKQLGDNYPNILKYINNEKASNEELAAILKIVNAEYDKKYKIAKNEGQIDVESKAINDAKSRLDLVNDLIDKLENQDYRDSSQEIKNGFKILNDGSSKSIKSLSDLNDEAVRLNSTITNSTEKIAGLHQEISDIASSGVDMDDYSSVTAKMNELAKQIIDAEKGLKGYATEKGRLEGEKILEKLNAEFDVYERRASELLKETNTEAGIDKRISKLKEERSNVELNSTKYNELTEQIERLEKRKPSNKKKDSSNDKTLKKEQKFADELLKLRNRNQMDEISLMEEGLEKKLAQIDYDYKNEIAEVKKFEAELRAEQGGKLTDQQSNDIESRYGMIEAKALAATKKANAEKLKEDKKRIDKEDQFLIEWNRRFGNILQQRQAIVDDYNKKIADSQGVNEKKLLESERDEALQKFDAKIAESSDLMTRLFADAAKMSVSEIKKIIKETEILLDLIRKEKTNTGSVTEDDAKVMGFSLDEIKALGGSIEDLDRILDALNGKKDALADSSPFESFKSDIDSSIDKIKKGFEEGSAKGIGSGVEGIGSGIQNFLPTLQKFSSDLGEIFGESFGESMDGFVKGLEALAETGQGVGKLLQGDISGILDVASGMAKIVGHSKRVNKEHREALKILERQREELEHMYAIAQLRASLEYKMKETVFGSDGWGKARNAADVYKQSVDKLKGSLKKLEDVDVVTGSKKSGWGFWKKRKDVWTDLLKAYPELIDRNGKFDKSLAQTILSTRKLTDEGKEFVQRAIDNAELVEDAYSNMKEYLTGIFGDLGNSITDAFVQAFENGADAFDLMRKSAADMIEQLAKEMVYSVTLDPLMDKYSKQMMDIASNLDLSDEDQFNRYMDIIDNLVDQAILQQGKANDLLQSAQDRAKEKGYEIFDGDSKSQNSTKGYSVAMDQDTGGAILGRVTGIHETDLRIEDKVLTLSSHTSELVNQVMRVGDHAKETMESIEEIKNIQLHSYYELKDINKNTSRLHEMSDTLESINSNIKDLLS